MISQETAELIWKAHREIQVGEQLLVDMQKAREEDHSIDRNEKTLKDAFGHRQHIQLGIPSGDNCHRLFAIAPVLADAVIRSHIASQRAALVELNERARIEIDVQP